MNIRPQKIALKYQDTYIFTDASNIRLACQKTLGIKIDFARFFDYCQQKYPNLKDSRYYEGLATDDERKRRIFDYLAHKGYTICPLERKAYTSTVVEEREVECPKCHHKWTIKFSKDHKILKSNVDCFLTADMVALATQADHPIHIILVSCDGDYAEAIKIITKLNKNVSVTVLATPHVKDFKKNTLSVRLRVLESQVSRYRLQDISSIRDYIKAKD